MQLPLAEDKAMVKATCRGRGSHRVTVSHPGFSKLSSLAFCLLLSVLERLAAAAIPQDEPLLLPCCFLLLLTCKGDSSEL